jgi:hypothetical protein
MEHAHPLCADSMPDVTHTLGQALGQNFTPKSYTDAVSSLWANNKLKFDIGYHYLEVQNSLMFIKNSLQMH